MPPGAGKTLLRCSVPTHIHAALKAEAEARRVDIGDVLEGRLDLGPVHAPVGMPQILQRLEVLGQRQEAMLTLLEQLVAAVAGPVQASAEATDEQTPIASYEDLYRQPAVAPQVRPRAEPEPRRKRWPF